MSQKVLKVGSSAAVTIPKQALKELGLRIGDTVDVVAHRAKREVSIRPTKGLAPADERIAELTASFITRYRADLEALAKE